MPVTKLKKSAKKAGLKPGTKRYGAYVYGTEHKIEKRRSALARRNDSPEFDGLAGARKRRGKKKK